MLRLGGNGHGNEGHSSLVAFPSIVFQRAELPSSFELKQWGNHSVIETNQLVQQVTSLFVSVQLVVMSELFKDLEPSKASHR